MTFAAPLWRRFLLYIILASMCTFTQHRIRELNYPDKKDPYSTRRIGEQHSKPPYQRRILMPFVAVQLERQTGVPLDLIVFFVRWFFLSALLMLFDVYMRRQFDGGFAMHAALLLLALLPFGFPVNPVIDSYPAMLALVAGLLLITERRYAWLIPLVFVATLVRESSLLILVLGAVYLLKVEKEARFALGKWLAGAAVTYLGVRFGLSQLYPGQGFLSMWRFNLEYFTANPKEGVLQMVPLFGPFVIAALGIPLLKGFTRQVAVVGCVYALSLLAVSRMNEPRVFFEAYVCIVPAILAAAGLAGSRQDGNLLPA